MIVWGYHVQDIINEDVSCDCVVKFVKSKFVFGISMDKVIYRAEYPFVSYSSKIEQRSLWHSTIYGEHDNLSL